DAVRLAAETDPDVILMDVRMPLEDGIQATRRIKQELGLRAVVITSTTYAWNEIRYEAYRAGASLHLPKPFDLERLKRVLHDAHVLAKRPPAEPDERLGWAAKDRKSTRLNSSHVKISYAVFCLKKKKYAANCRR